MDGYDPNRHLLVHWNTRRQPRNVEFRSRLPIRASESGSVVRRGMDAGHFTFSTREPAALDWECALFINFWNISRGTGIEKEMVDRLPR